mgnify:CR=1 FL=1
MPATAFLTLQRRRGDDTPGDHHVEDRLAHAILFNLRNIGPAVGKGSTLLAVKWVVGALVGLIAYMFAGSDGLILGMVPLAIIV